MYSRAFIVALFCIGLTHCAINIEDVTFLENAVDRYSPVLVKDLLMDRINHKIEQIEVVLNSTGINSKQIALCNSVHEGFVVLLSDLELMEESQFIRGDDTYDKTMKGFISEFASLTQTFNREFEFLKLPDLTKDTPDALLEIKVTDYTSFNNVKSKLSASLNTYQSDVKKYDSTDKSEVIRVAARATTHNLEELTKKVTALSDLTYNYITKLQNILLEFKQIVDIFYRQLATL